MKNLSILKNYLVPDNKKDRIVLFGIYSGLKLEINLRDKLQVYLGLWERETYPYIKKNLKNTEWFIDVGSGDGELCLLFLKKSGVSVIYAFDPLVECTDQMIKDLKVNSLSNDSRLNISNMYVGNSQYDNYVKLDDISIDTKKNGFIKIDVEGFELDVLKSGKSILKNDKINLLIETHSMELEKECISYLNSLNYKIKIINNAWWRFFLPEYRPSDHNRWLWASKS